MSETKELTTLQRVCKTWCERERALGYKGKTADKLCLEYFVGVYAALNVVAPDEANKLSAFIGILVAVRGAFEVRKIAAEADKAE